MKIKKIVAMLLTLSMLLSLVPGGIMVFAVGEGSAESKSITGIVEHEEVEANQEAEDNGNAAEEEVKDIAGTVDSEGSEALEADQEEENVENVDEEEDIEDIINAEEAGFVMNARTGSQEPAAYYDMSLSAGKLVDITGNGWNAELSSAVDEDDFVDGEWVLNNDKTKYAELPVGIVDSKNFTIETYGTVGAAADQFLWVLGTTEGVWPDVDDYIFLNPKQSGGSIRSGIKVGTEVRFGSTPSIVTGTYHAITVTSSDEGVLKLYVDGVLASTLTHGYDTADILAGNGDYMGFIGKSVYTLDAGYTGKLASFKVYNYTLTDDDIANNYENEYEDEDEHEVDTGELVAHYDMSLTEYGELEDITGNSWDAELSGSVSADDFASGVWAFDNDKTKYAELPMGIVRSENFTIETYGTVGAAADQFLWVLGTNEGTWPSPDDYIFLNPKQSGGNIRSGIKVGSEVLFSSTPSLETDAYHAITVTSSDEGVLKLYVDGVLTSTLAHGYDTTDILDESGDYMGFIGKSVYTPDAGYTGKLASFKVYDYTLSASEIIASAAEYTEPIESELVAHYDMSLTGSGELQDVTGNGYDAILSSAVNTSTDFADGMWTLTDNSGNSKYASLPSGILDKMAGEEFTIKVLSSVSATTNQFLWVLGTTEGAWPIPDNYIFLNPKQSSGTIRSGIKVTTESLFSDPPTLTANTFYDITITSSDDGVLKLYVDGALAGTLSHSNSLEDILADDGGGVIGYIGKSLYNEDAGYTGSIDDFKLYNYTLSAEEIAEEYQNNSLAYLISRIDIPNSDDIRGNISLPAETNGILLTWTEVTGTGLVDFGSYTNSDYDDTPAGAVTRPSVDTEVTLRVSGTYLGETESKDITITVKAAADPVGEDDYYGYLFTYFIGQNNDDQEQIYMALSTDGLNYTELKDNTPILRSVLGETGVRDPYLIRSAEGDKFYLIATDLQIADGRGWGVAQTAGSQSIMVWESTDLVNWEAQRMVELSVDIEAGCTWAPEASYDPITGEYIIYWASKVAADGYSKPRVYYAKTRDFYTFTEPQVLIESSATGQGVIDTTVIYDEATGYYYRYTKNEGAATIFAEQGTTLLGSFTTIAAELNFNGVEGPEIFKFIGENKWCLLLDDYGGVGYFPSVSTALANSAGYTRLSTGFDMPDGARHGNVIRLTQEEYEALAAEYGPEEENRADLTDGLSGSDVTVSSVTSDYSGSNTIDNDISTFWVSANNTVTGTFDEQWVAYDFGELKYFDTIVITGRTLSATARIWIPRSVEIQTSEDGETWTTVETFTDLEYVESHTLEFDDIASQYVRILVTDAWSYSATGTLDAPSNNVQIAEIEIYEAENQEDMLLYYDFTDVNGTTITDASSYRNDGTIKGTGVAVSDGVLTLPGGSSGSGAGYVQLPTGMFDDQDTLTVSAWLKNETGSGNYAALFFGTTESYPTGYWLLNPANPNGYFKSVITNSYSTSPWSTEYGFSPTNSSQGITGPVTDSEWGLYTTVIQPGSITAYYNGKKIGAVPTSRNVSDFGSNLAAYIGRSSYSDKFYKGSVKELKVYKSVWSDVKVKSEYYNNINNEGILTEALQADLARISLYELYIDDIELPVLGDNGSIITWTSGNTDYVTDEGAVTRPAAGEENETVTLTATLTLGGETLTKDFTVTILSDTPENDLLIAADRLEVGIRYVTEDIILPSSIVGSVSVVWSSDSAYIDGEGAVTRPEVGNGDQNITLTATLVYNSDPSITRTKDFSLIIAEETYGYLMTYVESGDTEDTDNLHLASSTDANVFSALNNNRGVLYMTQSVHQMGSPSLFRNPDGTYGLIVSDNNGSSCIVLYDSKDMITYTNERYVQITNQSVNVIDPAVKYDNSIFGYRITWKNSDGKIYMATTKDFVTFTDAVETDIYPTAVITASGIPEGAIETSVFEVTRAEYQAVVSKYGRVTNIGIGEIENVTVTAGSELSLPDYITASYSDGSTKNMGIDWEAGGVDLSVPGTYSVTGNVRQNIYTNPLVEERADPYAVLGDDGYYYFTGSYPTYGNGASEGYDRIELRRAAAIEGLSDAEPVIIWDEENSSKLHRYIWAPEMHYIGGKWYVMFSASTSSTSVWTIRPVMLQCSGDPMNPDNWVEIGRVQAAAGDTEAFNSFSLDMTYFEVGGIHYLIWAEKPGYSNLRMATIDPDRPWVLTSQSILLSTPEYAWEWNASQGQYINEGPSVIMSGGKVCVFYSASTVDERYCIGYLSASTGGNLMDPDSWTKNPYPVMTSDDFYDENGPGHNSFTVDTYGNTVIFYHARPDECADDECNWASSDALNDPCRHARVKNVNFAADGTPILNMTYDEELNPAYRSVTMSVVVTSENGGHTEDVAVTGVSLNANLVPLTPGSTVELMATVAPDNATNQNVTWSSDNSNVASVSQSGKVTAVSAGTAIITVTTENGGFTAECVIIVQEAGTEDVAVTGVELNQTKLSLTQGNSSTLTATIAPDNATNQNVIWSSDNSNVASVNESGKVTAVSAGTAIITVKTEDGGYTAVCTVKVTATSANSSSESDGDSSTSAYGTTTVGSNRISSEVLTVNPEATPLGITDGQTVSYLSGYPDGTIRPDGSLTRAELAQLIFNLYSDEADGFSETNYPDLSSTHWAYEAISFVTSGGYMVGYTDGTFAPDKAVTRAEFATVFSKVKGLTDKGEAQFVDVTGHWAEEYILTLAERGAVNGYEDGTFRPDRSITRAEITVVINKLEGLSLQFDNKRTFTDLSEEHWAYPYMMNAANGYSKNK